MTDFNDIERVASGADLDRPASDDAGARVEQLATEIDETRDDLGQTIAQIGDRLDPANIAREAGETVRDATIGKVEQMTYGAQETWRDVRSGNTGSIVDTITSNPIPAGMVALGIGLLFMSRGKRSGDSSPSNFRGYGDRGGASWDRRAWEQKTGTGGSPLDAVGSKVSEAGDQVGRMADQAGEKAGELMHNVSETAGQLPEQAGYYVQQGSHQVRRFIDENPLGAGAIALAAGAAIGLMLPSTGFERDTIGQARDELVGKVEGVANEALDKVDEQVASATA